jgi:hypothetical protein
MSVRPRQLNTALLAAVPLVLLLAAAPRADAQQYSFTTPVCYDTSVLTKQDWAGLERDFQLQSFRGSMALVFPKRAPITDPAQIKKWVKEKPLLGFAFPGLNADAVGSWALAKQLALSNYERGKTERPVVAVNSGWTDLGMGLGHFYELAGIRSAVNAGKADRQESMSSQVAQMIKDRVAHQRAAGKAVDPIVVGGHSAGGFYSANVAWLLNGQGRDYLRPLRVYNISLSARLPEQARAVQTLGTRDMVALANTSTPALLQPSTRLVDSLSHNGGVDWTFGDTLSARRWQARSLKRAFGPTLAGARGPRWNTAEMIKSLRQGVGKTRTAATEARKLARKHVSGTGVEKVVALRLDHDATMLELRAQRQGALADLLDARQHRDRAKITAARATLRSLRQQRNATRTRLKAEAGKVYRNMLSDSAGFMTQMMTETARSMTPWTLWKKSVQAMGIGATMSSRWMSAMLRNPLTNPWAVRPRERSSRPSRAQRR